MPKKIKLKLEKLSIQSFQTNQSKNIKGGYSEDCQSDARCPSNVRRCTYTIGNNLCFEDVQ